MSKIYSHIDKKVWSLDFVDNKLPLFKLIKFKDINFSRRVQNSMKQNGISTLYDFVIKKENEVLSIKNLGETSIKEITKFFESINFSYLDFARGNVPIPRKITQLDVPDDVKSYLIQNKVNTIEEIVSFNIPRKDLKEEKYFYLIFWLSKFRKIELSIEDAIKYRETFETEISKMLPLFNKLSFQEHFCVTKANDNIVRNIFDEFLTDKNDNVKKALNENISFLTIPLIKRRAYPFLSCKTYIKKMEDDNLITLYTK